MGVEFSIWEEEARPFVSALPTAPIDDTYPQRLPPGVHLDRDKTHAYCTRRVSGGSFSWTVVFPASIMT